MSWKLLLALVAGVILLAGCDGGFQSQNAQSQGTSIDTIVDFNSLEWRVGPNQDMNWSEANEWVESLGGSWRFPTPEELGALNNAGIREYNWDPFPNPGGSEIWSIQPIQKIRFQSEAPYYDFLGAYVSFKGKASYVGMRAFAVRSPQ